MMHVRRYLDPKYRRDDIRTRRRQKKQTEDLTNVTLWIGAKRAGYQTGMSHLTVQKVKAGQRYDDNWNRFLVGREKPKKTFYSTLKHDRKAGSRMTMKNIAKEFNRFTYLGKDLRNPYEMTTKHARTMMKRLHQNYERDRRKFPNTVETRTETSFVRNGVKYNFRIGHGLGG